MAIAPEGAIVFAVGIGIEQLLQDAALHVGDLRLAGRIAKGELGGSRCALADEHDGRFFGYHLAGYFGEHEALLVCAERRRVELRGFACGLGEGNGSVDRGIRLAAYGVHLNGKRLGFAQIPIALGTWRGSRCLNGFVAALLQIIIYASASEGNRVGLNVLRVRVRHGGSAHRCSRARTQLCLRAKYFVRVDVGKYVVVERPQRGEVVAAVAAAYGINGCTGNKFLA